MITRAWGKTQRRSREEEVTEEKLSTSTLVLTFSRGNTVVGKTPTWSDAMGYVKKCPWGPKTRMALRLST